jgi:hypothetical protein
MLKIKFIYLLFYIFGCRYLTNLHNSNFNSNKSHKRMSTLGDKLVVSEDVSHTVKALIERILQALESLSSQRSFITVGLSGGSLINQLADEIDNYLDRFKPFTSKLRFLYCDERFVRLNHNDSTHYGYAKVKIKCFTH